MASVQELRAEAKRRGVDLSGCVEKQDIVEKLRPDRDRRPGIPEALYGSETPVDGGAPASAVAAWTVPELKAELDGRGVDYSGCLERTELVERLAAVSSPSTAAHGCGQAADTFRAARAQPTRLTHGVLLATLQGSLARQGVQVQYVDLRRGHAATPLALEDAVRLVEEDEPPKPFQRPRLALTDTDYEEARSSAYRASASDGVACTILALPAGQRCGSDASTQLLAYRHGPALVLLHEPSLPELRAAFHGQQLFDHLDLDVNVFAPWFDHNFAVPPFIDPGYGDASHVRGGLPYRRPLGWQRFGLWVQGRFPEDDWLANDGRKGEWAVAYHGTSAHAVRPISTGGLKAGGRGELGRAHGAIFGEGVYCAPHVEHAAFFAEAVPVAAEGGSGGGSGGSHFQVVFQCRVRPGSFAVHNDGLGDIFVVPSEADVRPYGMLLAECDDDGTALLRCRDWP